MSITSNPASRLYEILTSAKKYCNDQGGRALEKEENVKDVWASIFDIDKQDEEKIFLSIVRVIEQIETVKKAVDKIESSSKNHLIKIITELEKEIMNMRLKDDSDSLKKALNEERLASLTGLAFALDARNQYCNIEEETILEFREKIALLIQDISDLQLKDELKKVVIDNLKQVDLMIENYKLYGVDGIKSAVENGFGSIMLNKELSEETNENSKFKETLIQVLNLFGNINTAVTFVKNVTPIAIEASDIAKKFFLS